MRKTVCSISQGAVVLGSNTDPEQHNWTTRTSCSWCGLKKTTNLNFTLWNVPTMLPAGAVSVPAALNDPNIYWLTQIRRPTVQGRAQVAPGIVRIADPMQLVPAK